MNTHTTIAGAGRTVVAVGNGMPAYLAGRHRNVYIAAMSAQATVEALVPGVATASTVPTHVAA